MTLNPDLVRARCAEIEESVRRLEQVAALLHAVRSSWTERCHPEQSEGSDSAQGGLREGSRIGREILRLRLRMTREGAQNDTASVIARKRCGGPTDGKRMVHRNQLRDRYWLYVVVDCATNAVLYRVQDPAFKLAVKSRQSFTVNFGDILREAEHD